MDERKAGLINREQEIWWLDGWINGWLVGCKGILLGARRSEGSKIAWMAGPMDRCMALWIRDH